MSRTRFVAVGSDGVRLVVWGCGYSSGAARIDAEVYLRDTTGPWPELDIHEITDEQYAAIVAGNVAWPIGGQP